jgi:hypothetical protein
MMRLPDQDCADRLLAIFVGNYAVFPAALDGFDPLA